MAGQDVPLQVINPIRIVNLPCFYFIIGAQAVR